MSCKVARHPFGRENEVAVKQLFAAFCNHLFLGQWELARACINELHDQKEVLQIDITETLHDLVDYPYYHSLGSETVKTPHHLSWLCFLELERITPEQNKESVEKLQKYVQFMLLLVESCQNASSAIIKELYQYNVKVRNESRTESPGEDVFLSVECQEFVCYLLFNQPAIGHALIQSLQPDDSSYSQDSQTLWRFYLKCLVVILNDLRNLKLSEVISTVRISPIAGLDDMPSSGELVAKFYQILALFDPDQGMNLLSEPVRCFLTELVDFLLLDNTNLLRWETVYSVLLGRSSSYLLEEFCQAEHKQRYRRTLNQVIESSNEKAWGSVLTDTEQYLVMLSGRQDRRASWKDLLSLCYTQKQHFLDLILDCSMHLIKHGQMKKLQQLLAPEEFRPLKPIVLLQGLTHCNDVDNSQLLIKTLGNIEDKPGNTILTEACRKATYHVDLVKWCLEKIRVLSEDSMCSIPPKCSQVFLGLKAPSVLYMLHHCTNLPAINSQQVLGFLANRPSHDKKDSVAGKSHRKSVHFALDTEEKTDVKAIEERSPVCNEQHRDVSIYRAYCFINHVMEALAFSVDTPKRIDVQQCKSDLEMSYANSTVSNTTNAGHLVDLKSGNLSLNHESEDIPESSFHNLYELNVTNKLHSAKEHISKTYPLTLRVEMLENSFSLLFATHDEIQVSDASSLSDSGEESMDDGYSNRSSVASRESIDSQAPSLRESLLTTQTNDPFTDSVDQTNLTINTSNENRSFVRSKNETRESGLLDTSSPYKNTIEILSVDESDTKDQDSKKVVSGPQSTNSNTSTCSIYKHGFIANEYIVRDVLFMLKDCLVDVTAERYTLLGQLGKDCVDGRASVNLADPNSRTSVDLEDLQHRITALTQQVSEAMWRYQLVVHDWVPPEFGKVSTDHANSEDSSSDDEWYRESKHHPRRRRWKKSSSTSSGKESDKGLSAQESDTCTGGSASQSSTSSSHRRHRFSHQESPRHGCCCNKPNVVSRMLSSKQTLLCVCLKRNKFAKAEQVVKIFGMDDSEEAAEVAVSQQYLSAVKKLQAVCPRSPISGPDSATFSYKSRPQAMLKQPSLSAIASVAAIGVASFTITSTVDHVLGLPRLPTCSLEKIKHSAEMTPPLTKYLSAYLTPAMVVLDMACSGCQTYETSRNLLEMAMIRVSDNASRFTLQISKETGGFEKRRKSITTKRGLLGIVGFLERLAALNSLGVGESLSEPMSRMFTLGLNQSLNTPSQPLVAASLKTLVGCISDVEKGAKKVERALEDYNGIEPTSAVFAGLENTFSKRRKPLIKTAMKQLISAVGKQLPSGGLIKFLLGLSVGADEKYLNYLQTLYDHVESLASLVLQHSQERKDINAVEYFEMLNETPTQTLGRLIFVNKVFPSRLEKMAEKLGLNLTQIIVKNCCPRIPIRRLFTDTSDVSGLLGTREGSLILLNELGGMRGDTIPHPELFIRDTLTKLVKQMKALSERMNSTGLFTLDCARVLLKSLDCRLLLTSLRMLQFIDLSLLKSDSEKLSFYGNLYNMMHIHGMLYELDACVSQMEQPLIRQISKASATSLSSVSSVSDGSLNTDVFFTETTGFDHLLFQLRMTYRVGQLGRLSLFDLKNFIVRNGYPLSYLDACETVHTWYELDPLDPWCCFGLVWNENLAFTLLDGSTLSPPLVVLSPELITQQLDVARLEYLTGTVRVDSPKQTVIVPEWLMSCCDDYQGDSVQSERFQYESLLQFIASHVSAELKESLLKLLPAKDNKTSEGLLEPIVMSHRYQKGFVCALDYLTWQQNLKDHHVTSVRRSSLPSYLRSSSVARDIKDNRIQDRECRIGRSPYDLTRSTLEYLKSNSDIIATLTSLVCSDEIDQIQTRLKEDHFPIKTPDDEADRLDSFLLQTTQGVRQFKYQKLKNDYLVLQRHIRHQLLPLLAARDSSVLLADDVLLEMCCTSINISDRIAILCAPSHAKFLKTVHGIVMHLFNQRLWSSILQLLEDLPPETVDIIQDWKNIKNLCLCLTGDCHESDQAAKQITAAKCSHLMQNTDLSWKARAILGNLKYLDVFAAMRMLKVCDKEPDLDDRLRVIVRQRHQELHVYERITECARSMLNRISLQTQNTAVSEQDSESHFEVNQPLLEKLCRWQEVATMSISHSDVLLDVLIEAQKFDLAKDWAQTLSLPSDLLQALEGEKDRNAEACYKICDNLLSKLNDKNKIVFVADFMLCHLHQHMSVQQRADLQVLGLGCKALQSLPMKSRAEYEHLISEPLLLVEQLVMNMKIEWAGKVITMLRTEATAVSDLLDLDVCDDLLITYATKALEFSVIKPDQPGNLTRAESRLSLASVASQQSVNIPGRVSTVPSPIKTSKLIRVESTNVATQRSDSALPNVTSWTGRRVLFQSGTEPEVQIKLPFVMPDEPPTRDHWIPDSAASVCMVCETESFSMLNRRHHCRRCGRVVCALCSKRTTTIRGVSAKTCDQCYEQIYKPKETPEELHRLQKREKLSGMCGGSPASGVRFIVGSVTSEHSSDGEQSGDPSQSVGVEYQYFLSLDKDENQMTREDFYYDNAPSTSLCLSVLELHSDPRQCGNVILDLCDEVSKLLQPLAPGVRNPEVDYGLVISMLKYLLFHAKVKFMKSGANGGVSRCDVYKDRVNILELLISHNCSFIPSILQLTKMDSIRRLRDKLIETERLSLAMEVSTKCGIDPAGVWIAWGMACLKAADLTAAREKFSKCLKPPVDKNQVQAGGKLLIDIIDTLETVHVSDREGGEALLSPLKSIKQLLQDPLQVSQVDGSQDDVIFQEKLYYLQTYGTHLALVNFYRKHENYTDSLLVILNKSCPPEIFVEGVLIPNLASGDFGKVKETMLLIDATLQKWGSYLTAACRYLTKAKCMNVLYNFQLFMRDYIRAAMTCITYFYGKGAVSYLDLYERLSHLQSAKTHLETFLEERQWSSVGRYHASPIKQKGWSRGSEEETPVLLLMTPGEVTKYIHTIDLQTEVTKYLHHYHDNLEALLIEEGPLGVGSPATVVSGSGGNPFDAKPSSTLPTLFSSTKVKARVASLVIMSGNNVPDGFGLAFRIIQDFKLDATTVYTSVGKQVAKQRKYGKIHQLLRCINDSGLSTNQSFDEVISACIQVVASNPAEGKEADSLIKLIRSDSNKVNAYIQCGKLKSAYLIAVKSRRVEDIERIAQAAQAAGQTTVKNICDKWLLQHRQTHS